MWSDSKGWDKTYRSLYQGSELNYFKYNQSRKRLTSDLNFM